MENFFTLMTCETYRDKAGESCSLSGTFLSKRGFLSSVFIRVLFSHVVSSKMVRSCLYKICIL